MELQDFGRLRAKLLPRYPEGEKYHLLGEIGEIPSGSTKMFRLNGREIAVFHVNQDYFAFKNSCPHHGVELATAKIENGSIRCPGHGYQFDLKTGQCDRDPFLRASTYDLKIEGDQIFIRMK
jgi:nitrite reductase/ring-hydroxylating ferredoxin subunit